MHHVFSFFLSQHFLRGLLLSGLIAGLTAPAAGLAVKVFRCSVDGRVEFRQTSCPTGKQERVQVTQQSHGMTPVKPALRLEPNARKQKKHQHSKVNQAGNEERCWKTERKLKRIEQRLRGGYKASEYQKLHRRQDEYEEYLRQFCRS